MCLAVPGKIVKIDGDTATVDYEVEKRQGKILEGEYNEGDYVIIQAGIIMAKIDPNEAKETLELFKQGFND